MAKVICSSERLLLQEISQSHFEGLCKLLASDKVMEYFPKTLNPSESQQFLEKCKVRQTMDGYSFWAVIRKIDLQFLGICGVLKQQVDGVEEFEVAYRINDRYWGKGYATEAAKACMEYARYTLSASSIISCILPENIASIRVAEKNGMTLEKNTLFHGYDVFVYRKNF